jgi:hypothetical protein
MWQVPCPLIYYRLRIVGISKIKYVPYFTLIGQQMRKKSFYAPKQIMIFIASIFTKLINYGMKFFFFFWGGGDPCDVFHIVRNEKNADKISFTPLTNAWLSLHQFSRNSQLSVHLKNNYCGTFLSCSGYFSTAVVSR